MRSSRAFKSRAIGRFATFARAPWAHSGSAPAALVLASLCLAGCHSPGGDDITGSIGQDGVPPASGAQLQRYTEDLGQRYDQQPYDKPTAMAYARALRASGRYDQAVAVVQRLAAKYPKDMQVLGAYGKALVEDGRLQEAASVLPEAHTPDRPSWSILSAQGTVADQLGDHDQAKDYYRAALKIAPNQPAVLSNLGLSYALSRQLPEAEQTLQLAAAQPGADTRVRQNLALVLALEGKFNAAQGVAQEDLAPVDAAENVAAIRQMVAQSDTWNQIQSYDKPKVAAASHRMHHYARLEKAKTQQNAQQNPQDLRPTQVGAAE
jgi:Flp pilus assembly protein TadD